MDKRVVVTGVGMVTPLGHGKTQFSRNLFGGASGIDKITRFKGALDLPGTAGEVRGFKAREFINPRNLRRMDKLSTFAVAASRMALDDADVRIDDTNRKRVGVILGTAFGSTPVATQFAGALFKDGPRLASPILVPNTVMNAPAGHVAIEIGAQGINSTLNHRETSAEHALTYAAMQISLGRVDIILTGGVDIISEFQVRVLMNFKALGPVCTDSYYPRPFDRLRQGPVVGEGAGVVCLESWEHARQRGVVPYCEIAGAGLSAASAPANDWSRDPAGSVMAIRRALEEAHLTPGQIGYVSACANGGRRLDELEAQALTAVFGEAPNQPWISTLKGTLGESYSAGGIRAAAMALGLQSQLIPPTLGVVEPLMPLRLVTEKARPVNLQYGLLNTLSSGGTFAALLFKRSEAQ